jgi:ABC-type branched-subunit amino acid transport system substrate-binding protein
MASEVAEHASIGSVRAFALRAIAPGGVAGAKGDNSANKHISNRINSVIRSAESGRSNPGGCEVIWLVMALIEDNSGNWRVGVLFSQTGVTAAIERTQLNATLLGIEEINASGGVLGRLIEPVMYDPASDPKKFRVFAERLFQVDRIRLLFACYMSSTRKAVLPVVEAHRGLLFYPTLYGI